MNWRVEHTLCACTVVGFFFFSRIEKRMRWMVEQWTVYDGGIYKEMAMIWWYCATVGKFCKTLRSLSMSLFVLVFAFFHLYCVPIFLAESVSFESSQLHLPHSPSFSLHSRSLYLRSDAFFFISSCVRFVLPFGILFWLLCILCVNVSYECLCPFRVRLLRRSPWNIFRLKSVIDALFLLLNIPKNAHKVWLS